MKRHPIFARVFVLIERAARAETGPNRDETLAPARGRVIEVGCGHGENFMRYPAQVTDVVAVEPEPYLRAKAQQAAGAAPVPVRVVDGVAEALPAGDGEFDTAVASLVLCSVPDQQVALAELRRVLKPGGTLLFYEHVIAEDPKLRRTQRRLAPIWRRLGGGCNLDRDTVAAVQAAGFEVEHLRRFDIPRGGPVAPHVIGVALRT